MYWIVFCILSCVAFLVFAFLALLSSSNRGQIKWLCAPYKLFGLGTMLSAFLLFLPIYHHECSAEPLSVWTMWIKIVLCTLHNALRIFMLDDSYLELMRMLAGAKNISVFIRQAYVIVAAFLHICAPVLTFGFVLSFFKNFSSYLNYWLSFAKEVHFFSELNEMSLALAKSIDARDNKKYKLFKKSVFVFADILDKNEELHVDLVDGAKRIGAILFRKDICSIHKRKCKHKFYLIGTDEVEKIRHITHIIRQYKCRPNNELYVFSHSAKSMSLLDSYTEAERKGMKLTVIRVDDIRALIYHNLDVNGIRLFEHANQVGEGEREISAVIVGLGRYGTEMVKALLWYCQIPGYRVRITVFDEHEDAKDRFQAMCPDLRIGNFMNEKGDMRYALRIHTARVGTKTFLEKIETVVAPTYVFVSLGDDNENISTAISIRNALQRKSPDSDRRTDIETVVYDSVLKRRVGVAWSDEEKKDAFEETQMSAYQIHTIGDIDSFYSVKTLINSNLIQEGLEVHKRWSNGTDTELAYYMDGYCYFSSVAGALHRRLRLKILRYEPKTQKEKVFPAFCETSDQGADSNPDAMRLIRVCEQLNDNDSVNRLSEQMKKDTHCLYIKLAQLHFGRLSADERYRVLQWVKTASEKKEKEKAEAALKVLARFNDPGSYLQVYEQLLTDYIEQKRSQADDSMAMGEVLRRLFDGIVAIKTATVTDVVEYHRIRQSLDYENQSSEDRLAVEEFVRTVNPQVNLRKIVDDVRAIARLEHVRWNAYMRTEGFRAVANQNKKFKMHSDLVSVELLSLSDCIKDI